MSTLTPAESSELDEALRHLSRVPEDERGAPWRAYSDALLERKLKGKP